jgi:hypothetical protein
MTALLWPRALTTIGSGLTIQKNDALTAVVFEAFTFACPLISRGYSIGTTQQINRELSQPSLIIDDNGELASIAINVAAIPLCAYFGWYGRTLQVDSLVDYGGIVRPEFPGLMIRKNEKLGTISMPQLTSVGGDLSISGNAVLTSLAPFGSLTSVRGSLMIENNAALADLDGLSSLQIVTGSSLTIANNQALESIHLANLEALGAVGGLVDAGQCSVQRKVIQLEGGGSLTITQNTALAEIILPKLTQIGNSLRVEGNDALEGVSGLDGIDSIGAFKSTPFERLEFQRREHHQMVTKLCGSQKHYSYPPSTCVGDLNFSFVPGCPSCEQKWRESATRTRHLDSCDSVESSVGISGDGSRAGGCFTAPPPLDERLICVGDSETTSDDGSGSSSSASLMLIIPIVIAAVLLVAAALCYLRKRAVDKKQHRRTSMPTVGGKAEEGDAP